METENLEPQGENLAPQNEGVENTNPQLAFKPEELRFVDTSSQEYWDKELGREQTPQQEPQQEQQQTDYQQQEQAPQEEGNPAFNAYKSWAEARGLEINEKNYDVENFGEEEMERAVGSYYARKYYSNVDPQMSMLAENNINLQEYIQQRSQIEQVLNTDPTQVAKGYLYNQKVNELASLRMLEVDQEGNITQMGQQKVIQQVEALAQQMGEERLRGLGSSLHQSYYEQLNSLPNQMVEQQQARVEQEVHTYNNQLNQALGEFEEHFKTQNKLVTNFSGEAEKKQFLEYMRDNLSMQKTEQGYVTPFMQKLNDSEYLAKLVRLSFLLENGAFTDITNRERNAAYNELSVAPLLGKSGSGKKTSSSGLKIMPTWERGYNG